MICLLSYLGMNLQSEVCLWTLLGILRTILEATSLFKVNDKLKQVWQMPMPAELSMPVQRAFRTMICSVLLVQCFTVYVYLAAYVVLLYPIMLEERPTLVLLWLLLAAIRNFLCELTTLALGLGACVLLGPSKPSCLKFALGKIVSIAPSMYMWMLVHTYYKGLKLAVAFKTFPAVVQSSDHDYGLEMAVRRRMTKSLQKESQLRRNMTAIFTDESKHLIPLVTNSTQQRYTNDTIPQAIQSDLQYESATILEVHDEMDTSERLTSNLGVYEDWCGDEVTLPRDTDRILEQFVLMMLRISAYLKSGQRSPRKLFSTMSPTRLLLGNLDCSSVNNDDTEPPPSVGNSKPRTTSYIQEYPHIFMKKTSDSFQRIPEQIMGNQFTKQPDEKTDNNTVRTPLDSKKPIKESNSQETSSGENITKICGPTCVAVPKVELKDASVSTELDGILLKEVGTSDTHISNEVKQPARKTKYGKRTDIKLNKPGNNLNNTENHKLDNFKSDTQTSQSKETQGTSKDTQGASKDNSKRKKNRDKFKKAGMA